MEIDEKILKLLKGRARELYLKLKSDKEVRDMLKQANLVSIKRLGYNDHGEVHAKIVTLNSLKMLEILSRKRIKPSVLSEKVGDFEDVQIVLILSAYLHDVGMAIMREDHEKYSVFLAKEVIEKYLKEFASNWIRLRNYVYEGILCHMGNRESTSIEAGIVAVADGCDMTKGRARISFSIGLRDIHEYSAEAINEVKISKGKKGIKIDIYMSSSAGVFQVEDILLPKIKSSSIKDHLEVYSHVEDFGRKFIDKEW